MRTITFLLLLGFIFTFSSCRKIDDNIHPIVKSKLSGYVQKGPYVNGTEIRIYELDQTLTQTGNSFTTSIKTDKGEFEMNNISLLSQYVDISANGYYFNEVNDSISIAPLFMEAVADITDLTSVNINILTHLEKNRVKYLVSKGSTFSAAKDTAQNEILRIFGIHQNGMINSEQLDISVNEDDNSVLLAVSMILQGNRSVGELTKLLADIRSDIETDGKIDNTTILTDLRKSTLTLNPSNIQNNLQDKFNSLNVVTTIPDFSSYVTDFVLSTGGYPPTITTSVPTSISGTSAIIGGTITQNGGSAVTTKGLCWNTTGNPTISDNVVNINTETFSDTISNLNFGTTYYVRTFATNSAGIGYGNQITFTTLKLPVSKTLQATNINKTNVTLNGSVNPNNISTTVTIEYGTTSNYGLSSIDTLISGDQTINLYIPITGLTPGTLYHFRTKSINSVGISYGDDFTFKTKASDAIMDADGNFYDIVTIGTQVWMKENLKTTKYSNGEVIPNVTNLSSWISLPNGAYCSYNNDNTNRDVYGALYNFFAVTDNRNICPTGWHVPNNSEWSTLQSFIGGTYGTSPKLKEDGSSHWTIPNGTNETGFTALPAGYRAENGFDGKSIEAYWWSSSPNGTVYDVLSKSNTFGSQNDPPFYGHSVRCIKN